MNYKIILCTFTQWNATVNESSNYQFHNRSRLSIVNLLQFCNNGIPWPLLTNCWFKLVFSWSVEMMSQFTHVIIRASSPHQCAVWALLAVKIWDSLKLIIKHDFPIIPFSAFYAQRIASVWQKLILIKYCWNIGIWIELSRLEVRVNFSKRKIISLMHSSILQRSLIECPWQSLHHLYKISINHNQSNIYGWYNIEVKRKYVAELTFKPGTCSLLFRCSITTELPRLSYPWATLPTNWKRCIHSSGVMDVQDVTLLIIIIKANIF
jgi:hypothetical protein